MSITPLLRTILIMTAVFGYAMANAKAAKQRIECPKEIPREVIQVAQAPAGWKAFVPFEYRSGVPLTGAGVMYGPPSEMAISKPNAGSRNTSQWVNLRVPADGIWMACFYGDADRQDMILSRRLDDATKECAVTYGKGADKLVRLDILCRS